MKYILQSIIFIIALHASALFSQNNVSTIMNRISIHGSSELAKVISDPKVDITSKRFAVMRLGELVKDLPANKGFPASKLYNPILGVLTPQKGVEGHNVLREEACSVLGKFAEVKGSNIIIKPLGRVLLNSEEKRDVRIAAARALSAFRGLPILATDTLALALDKELKRGPKPNNVRVVSALVISMGRLGNKKAFVPLMRVLRSGFPAGTKRQAQAALESLEWTKN